MENPYSLSASPRETEMQTVALGFLPTMGPTSVWDASMCCCKVQTRDCLRAWTSLAGRAQSNWVLVWCYGRCKLLPPVQPFSIFSCCCLSCFPACSVPIFSSSIKISHLLLPLSLFLFPPFLCAGQLSLSLCRQAARGCPPLPGPAAERDALPTSGQAGQKRSPSKGAMAQTPALLVAATGGFPQ